MPRGTPKKKIEPVIDNTAAETPYEHPADEVTQAAEAFLKIDILDEAGNLHRTYSFADHGEKVADLADQFLAGHPTFHKA